MPSSWIEFSIGPITQFELILRNFCKFRFHCLILALFKICHQNKDALSKGLHILHHYHQSTDPMVSDRESMLHSQELHAEARQRRLPDAVSNRARARVRALLTGQLTAP
jgi:hypothetical protein